MRRRKKRKEEEEKEEEEDENYYLPFLYSLPHKKPNSQPHPQNTTLLPPP